VQELVDGVRVAAFGGDAEFRDGDGGVVTAGIDVVGGGVRGGRGGV
jgi:hypothetical protein